MSTLKVDTILKRTGTGTITLGQSGDTIALGSGASQTGFGGTNTPYFEAKMGSNQTPTDATWTKLNYDTEIYDSASAYDTSNYRYTPQTAGKYVCYLHVVFDTQAVDKFHRAYASIYKNGSGYKQSYFDAYDNYYLYGVTGTISTVIDFNGSSDYIEPYCFFDITSGNGRINNNDNSIFGAYKLIT